MRIKILLSMILVMSMLSGCSLRNISNAGQYEEEDEAVTGTVLEDNKKTVDDVVLYDEIAYKINNAKITQSLDNRDKDKVNYLTDEVDEQGNLLGDNQFVWIQLEVENQSNEAKEIVLNSNTFYNITEENKTVEASAEAVYISQIEEGRQPNQSFHCLLQPQEKRELEIGYILFENLEGDLYYGVGNGGSSIEDVNNKFIRIEEK